MANSTDFYSAEISKRNAVWSAFVLTNSWKQLSTKSLHQTYKTQKNPCSKTHGGGKNYRGGKIYGVGKLLVNRWKVLVNLSHPTPSFHRHGRWCWWFHPTCRSATDFGGTNARRATRRVVWRGKDTNKDLHWFGCKCMQILSHVTSVYLLILNKGRPQAHSENQWVDEPRSDWRLYIWLDFISIGSMYGILTYIYHRFMLNVGIYIYMPYKDPRGYQLLMG